MLEYIDTIPGLQFMSILIVLFIAPFAAGLILDVLEKRGKHGRGN
jgi:hypothetical protein